MKKRNPKRTGLVLKFSKALLAAVQLESLLYELCEDPGVLESSIDMGELEAAHDKAAAACEVLQYITHNNIQHLR